MRPELSGTASTSMRMEIGRRTRRDLTSSVGNSDLWGGKLAREFFYHLCPDGAVMEERSWAVTNARSSYFKKKK